MKPPRTLVWIVSIAAFLAFHPEYSRAQVANEASIRELLAISGHEESIKEGMNSILPALRQMTKNISEQKLREVTDPERIAKSIVIVYQKHFTEVEVREMLAFYRTPTGNKLGKLNTRVQGEAAELHLQRWRASMIDEQVQKGNFKVDPPK